PPAYWARRCPCWAPGWPAIGASRSAIWPRNVSWAWRSCPPSRGPRPGTAGAAGSSGDSECPMRNLFVILDGVGYDQLAWFKPDGLTSRAERVGLEPLTTLLAYSSGIYPSIWTGQYPDEHNVWTEFYRREHPRFALTAPLGLVPGKYLPRKIAYVAL